jgi:hypothetical protein
MARTKLGLSSSLDAARLLEDFERYQRAGPHPPDLAESVFGIHKWFTRKRTIGASVMTLLAATSLIFALQAGSQAPQTADPGANQEMTEAGAPRPLQDQQFINASPERVEAYVRKEFDVWDRDRSGFIELAEAPARIFVNSAPIEGYEARGHFVADFDKDGNGKVSYQEFAAKIRGQFLERGIPLVPADEIRVPADRDEARAEKDMKIGDVRALTPADMVRATPAEARAFAEDLFHGTDKNKSGFIERDEAPVTLEISDAKWAGDGPPPREWFEQHKFRPAPIEPVMAQAAFIAKDDKNVDGKLSFEEFWQGARQRITLDGVPKRWKDEYLAGR